MAAGGDTLNRVPHAPQLKELLEPRPDPDQLIRLLGVGPLTGNTYVHWEDLRALTPPGGLMPRDWWAGMKLAREKVLRPITLQDEAGSPFRYFLPDPVFELLHRIDRHEHGGVLMPDEATNPAKRDRFITDATMEESIASSQLEGALVTVEAGRDLLRSGWRPTERPELMVANNFEAMRFIQDGDVRELTPAFVLELHALLTRGTMDDAGKEGRLRNAAERIGVADERGNLLHIPPSPAVLPARLEQLCAFANDRAAESFVHPVVRAIALHFWMLYDQPFLEANGRAGRALFYWLLRARGYWIADFMSISQIIREAPAEYGRAFRLAVTDGNDLTYFLLNQVDVLRRAIDALQAAVGQKVNEQRELESLIDEPDLNHRQLAVLGHALKNPGTRFTIEMHRKSHDVVYQTARTDLLNLAQRGYLIHRKLGNAFVFDAPENLPELLKKPTGSGS